MGKVPRARLPDPWPNVQLKESSPFIDCETPLWAGSWSQYLVIGNPKMRCPPIYRLCITSFRDMILERRPFFLDFGRLSLLQDVAD